LPLAIDIPSFPRSSRLVGAPSPRTGRLSAVLAQQLFMIPDLVLRPPHVYHQLGLVADPAAGALPWVIHPRAVVTIHDLTPLVFKAYFFTRKRIRRLVYNL